MSSNMFGLERIHRISFPKLSKNKYYKKFPCDTLTSNNTTFISDTSLTKIQVHFRIVFSSASTIDLLMCSLEYCFKKSRHHKRCFGWQSAGASFLIRNQMSEHTSGVMPKNDLNRLSLVFWLLDDF